MNKPSPLGKAATPQKWPKEAADIKRALRAQMRALRRQMTEEERRAAAQAACGHLLADARWRRAKVILGYAACGGELDVWPLLHAALAEGKSVALPRCEGDALALCQIESEGDLSPGTMGILEPKAHCAVLDPMDIDLLLVPGLAFDRWGMRLGQGGGYYDRLLPKTRGLALGCGYDAQLIPRVPADSWDRPMDALLTPGGVLNILSPEGGENCQG